MASQITHLLAGEEALRRADPALAESTLQGRGAWFRLGCQGPDIFYHNQRTKPSGLHYGVLAHRRGYGELLAGAAVALPPDASPQPSPELAYLLGLATHAAVDRATHPFIVCFAGWPALGEGAGSAFRGCHPFLERLLDAGLLESRLGLAPSELDLAAALIPGAGEWEGPAREGVIGLWAAGIRAAYPRQAEADPLLERRVANALEDARYFYEATNPGIPSDERWRGYLESEAGLRAVALVYPEAPIPGLDALNLARMPWPHPSGDGRSSSASYLELFDEAVLAAAEAVAALLDALRDGASMASLPARVGSGSLAVADASGAAVAPRAGKPLPLARIMEEEYARRIDHAEGARIPCSHEHEGQGRPGV